jgi:hypothetical protein
MASNWYKEMDPTYLEADEIIYELYVRDLQPVGNRRANCASLRKALETERNAGVLPKFLNPSQPLDANEEVFEITEKADVLLKRFSEVDTSIPSNSALMSEFKSRTGHLIFRWLRVSSVNLGTESYKTPNLSLTHWYRTYMNL